MLYKYYSSLPESYLFNPTLKLAIPSKLNDPFENTVPNRVRIKHIEEMLKINKIEDDIFHDYIKLMNSFLISGVSSSGIISMSETPTNILMWSHYANSHTGLVIGYKTDVLSHLHNPYGIDACFFNTPQIVNYDNVRFQHINNTSSLMDRNAIIKSLLTTKSNHWRYEKEHRFIIPLGCANFCRPINKLKTETIRQLEILWKLKYIKECTWFETQWERTIGNNDGDIDNYPFIFNEEAERFLVKNNFDAFIRINPASINSVFFGAKFEGDKRNKIKDIISKNPHLRHIDMYECSISPDNFELDIYKI
ncbi:DUF2971 domain-containing protein [Aeromonas caviae]|uniref:DUF2971 domain-containing protein n=1 Tax=Aeromonas caviae TaxID=648 RepID=UPI002B4A0B01|nr:DUF2971 domain-containing protein [Aeromonas caviae]